MALFLIRVGKSALLALMGLMVRSVSLAVAMVAQRRTERKRESEREREGEKTPPYIIDTASTSTATWIPSGPPPWLRALPPRGTPVAPDDRTLRAFRLTLEALSARDAADSGHPARPPRID